MGEGGGSFALAFIRSLQEDALGVQEWQGDVGCDVCFEQAWLLAGRIQN